MAGGTLYQRTQERGGLGAASSDEGRCTGRALGGRGGDGIPAIAAIAVQADQARDILECVHPQAGAGLGVGNSAIAPHDPARNPKGEPAATGGCTAPITVGSVRTLLILSTLSNKLLE